MSHKDPNVNYYRQAKNPTRQTIVWEDPQTGDVVVHVVDLSKGYIKSFKEGVDQNGKSR